MMKRICSWILIGLAFGFAAFEITTSVSIPVAAQYRPPTGPKGATGATGPTGATGTAITAVNSSITASSLGAQAICALHTDTGCLNSSTDATSANCPAGTLTATCTFPTSITIPANALASNATVLLFSVGVLSTATLPNALVEVYLDSTRIYAGTANVLVAGSRSTTFACTLLGLSSSNAAPVVMSCPANGTVSGTVTGFGSNELNTNTAPAISIDTTVSHVLKVSISFSANTTGNMAWLYGMRFAK